MSDPIHIISLGAGVQSSTMALMAAKGEITPMPTAAIFADTQDEPDEVYRWLEYLTPLLPFPVLTVTAGKLSERIIGKKYIPIPSYGSNGGQDKRVCTQRFKIAPIRTKTKELLGRSGKVIRSKIPLAIMWIGISTDEVSRAKESNVGWIKNRFPLLMEHQMSRHECVRWLNHNGYPEAPQSACKYCPYRTNARWRAMRNNPFHWRDVLLIDEQLTQQRGMYLHNSRIPLRLVNLDQDDPDQVNLFNNECEGMCGV